MNPASLYSAKPVTGYVRRQPQFSQRDLFMYEAIVGKPAEFEEPAAQGNKVAHAATQVLQMFRKQVWAPKVKSMSLRLKAIYDQQVGQTPKRPPVGDWLRHMSDEAMKRLDQAQSRLHAAHPGPGRRRVEAREVMSVRVVVDDPADDYKRVA